MTSTAVEVLVVDIPITEIYRQPNHRIDEAIDKEALQRLAESMKTGGGETVGQQTPVRVHKIPDWATSKEAMPYVLAFGYRRMAAAELLGWTTIKAEILPPTDSITIETERAIENLERQDLNVMEEVETVTAMLTAADGDIDLVAARLGRSKKWVQDRSYLTRLFPRARKLVMQGVLLLGHARELAKIGDEHEQNSLCDYVATADPSSGVVQRWSVDKVRQDVEQRQRSLRIVGWELDIPFAGKPACVGCLHNTKTDAVLFDGAGAGHEAGTCMNGSCFAAKTAAAVKARDAVVKTLVKAGTAAISAVRDRQAEGAGDFLKPSWVQREAKKKLDDTQPAGAKAAAKSSGSSASDRYQAPPEQVALEKYRNKLDAWRGKAVREVVAVMTASQWVGLAMVDEILDRTGRNHSVKYSVRTYNEKKPEPFTPLKPPIVAMLKTALTETDVKSDLAESLFDVVQAAVKKGGYQNLGALNLMLSGTPELLTRIAGHLNVTLAPLPEFEAPGEAVKPKAEKPAAKKPPGNAAKGAKKTTKKVSKKAPVKAGVA